MTALEDELDNEADLAFTNVNCVPIHVYMTFCQATLVVPIVFYNSGPNNNNQTWTGGSRAEGVQLWATLSVAGSKGLSQPHGIRSIWEG